MSYEIDDDQDFEPDFGPHSTVEEKILNLGKPNDCYVISILDTEESLNKNVILFRIKKVRESIRQFLVIDPKLNSDRRTTEFSKMGIRKN